MNGTLRQFSAETYRVARARLTLLVAAVLVAVPALRVLAAWFAREADHAARVHRAFTEGRELPGEPGTGNAWAPFVDGWRAGLAVAALLLLLHAARALSGDVETGVARVGRTRSVSRGGLVLGRALLGVPLTLGALLLAAAGAGLAAAALFDFGPVVEDGYELISHGELRDEALFGALACGPALLATWCFGLCVSAVARSAAAAAGAALVLFLGFDLFKEVLGPAQGWVFATFVPSFVDASYLAEVSGMARGFSDAGFTAETLARNMWIPWPQAALLLLLACAAVSRRPL